MFFIKEKIYLVLKEKYWKYRGKYFWIIFCIFFRFRTFCIFFLFSKKTPILVVMSLRKELSFIRLPLVVHLFLLRMLLLWGGFLSIFIHLVGRPFKKHFLYGSPLNCYCTLNPSSSPILQVERIFKKSETITF